MPANTDGQTRRWREAFRSAAVSTLTQAAGAAVLLWLRQGLPPGGFAARLALLAAALELLTLPLVWLSLRTRLREIAGGEEEDASQY